MNIFDLCFDSYIAIWHMDMVDRVVMSHIIWFSLVGNKEINNMGDI